MSGDAGGDDETTLTWHVVSEGVLYRMLERAHAGEEPQVVMAMAMTTSIGEVVPEWEEMCRRVWDHWPSIHEDQRWRARAIRAVHPGLAILLDQIANTVARHMGGGHRRPTIRLPHHEE